MNRLNVLIAAAILALMVMPVVAEARLSATCLALRAITLASLAQAGQARGLYDHDDCALGLYVGDSLTPVNIFQLLDPAYFTTSAQQPGGCFPMANDQWFVWQALESGTLTVTVCGTVPIALDTHLAVYEDDGAVCDSAAPVPLACEDDSCGEHSQATVPVTAGNFYRVQLGLSTSTARGGEGQPPEAAGERGFIGLIDFTFEGAQPPECLSSECVFVDDDAPSGGDGRQWATAFVSIDIALASIAARPPGQYTIRLGGGTYPAESTLVFPAGAYTITLQGGYGGYRAIAEGSGDPNQIDLDLYPSLITGDLFGDDLPGDAAGRIDNQRLLFSFINNPNPSTIRGCILASAGGPPGKPNEGGTAVRVLNSRLNLIECVFHRNWATASGAGPAAGRGGAVEISGALSNVMINRCLLSENQAGFAGGAISVADGSLTITDSAFQDSRIDEAAADGMGGAIAVLAGGRVVVRRSSFNSLYAAVGGGVAVHGSGAEFQAASCAFECCSAHSDPGSAIGAAAIDVGSGATLFELSTCLFTYNYAQAGPGAVRIDATNLLVPSGIRHCLFYGNDTNSTDIAAVFITQGPAAFDEFSIVNTIFRENGYYAAGMSPRIIGQQVQNDSLGASRLYSCNVEGGLKEFRGTTDGRCFDEPSRLVQRFDPGPPALDGGFGAYGIRTFATAPSSPDIDRGEHASHLMGRDFADLDDDGDVVEVVRVDFFGHPRRADGSLALNPLDAPALPPDVGPFEFADGDFGLTWVGPAAGDLNDSARWFPSAEPNNQVLHLGDAASDVNLSGNLSVAALLVESANARLNLQGNTLDIGRGSYGPGTIGFPQFMLNPWGAAAPLPTLEIVGPGTFNPLTMNEPGWAMFGPWNMTISNGAEFLIGTMSLTPSIEVPPGGRLELNSSRVNPVRVGSTVLIVEPGGLFEFAGISGVGSILGNGGAMRPATGSGPATLQAWRYWDSYSLGQSGQLTLRVFGPAVGDVLDVQTRASFTGTLNIEFAGGFMPPAESNIFLPLITAPIIDGQFSLVNLPTLPDGRFVRVEYGPISAPARGAGGFGVSVVIDELARIIGFEEPEDFPAGPGSPRAAAVGDLDLDGDVDLALAVPSLSPEQPGSVVILFNAGTSMNGQWLGFSSSIQFPSGGVNPVALRFGEFDGANGLDIAVVNRASQTLVVHLNSATPGEFAPQPPVSVADPRALAVGDFDADLDDDIAVAGRDTSGFVNVYLNNGDMGGDWGGLAMPVTQTTDGDPSSIDPADMDDDKDIDLVVGDASGRILIVRNRGTTTRAWDGIEIGFVAVVEGDPSSIDPADMDDDKDIDVVAANRATGQVQILLNRGDGTLQPPTSTAIGPNPRSITSIDLDLDGDLDLAVIADESEGGPRVLKILRNDLAAGQIGLTPVPSPVTVLNPLLVLRGNVDGDADDDLITVNEEAGSRRGPPGPMKPEASVTVLLSAPACRADVDGSGEVGMSDVGLILEYWGQAVLPGTFGDANRDGTVSIIDLSLVIVSWGAGC